MQELCVRSVLVRWWLMGRDDYDFWTGRQGETPGPCPRPNSSSRDSMGVVTHPPISTAAPKHAGYLGSLRIDLWLKRCMQSQGRREQAGSCKSEHSKHIYWSTCNYLLQSKKSKTVVTMSVEKLLIRAVVRVSRYALHPPLWDAVTWWANWKTTHEEKNKKQKKPLLFWEFLKCVSASNTHSLTKKYHKSPPAHTHWVLYKHASVSVVHYFITDGVLGGQGGAWKVWPIVTQTSLKHMGYQMPAEENSDTVIRPCLSYVLSLFLTYH